MKKQTFNWDWVVVILLVFLLFGWNYLYDRFLAPSPASPAGGGMATSGSTNRAPEPAVPEAVIATPTNPVPAAVSVGPVPVESVLVAAADMPGEELEPEIQVAISNSVARLILTSRGGGIVSAELKKYRTRLDPDSDLVQLDFSSYASLTYLGLDGLGSNSSMRLEVDAAGQGVRITGKSRSGLRLNRTLVLGDKYQVRVVDELVNLSEQPVQIPVHGVQVGPMGLLPGEKRGQADLFLGIDSLASGGGEGVRYWNSKGVFSGNPTLLDLFQPDERRGGCSMTRPRLAKQLTNSVMRKVDTDLDWIAVKNKFFVQILEPPRGKGVGGELHAARYVPPEERSDNATTWMQDAVLQDVHAVMRLDGQNLAPGESLRREMRYYLGPREYESIRRLGSRQEEVMEFGMWSFICKPLVISMNFLYQFLPNFGVVIIVITLLIRIIFWPITHKGTESMKKLQELQPKILELREKYKDNPKEMQQKTWQLYRENKVNPVGGCLPMLIQIPVFIALYNILRSDIGLRFASFLWIRDLSEAENLLVGVLPFGLALNLLPIYMSATMAWQQMLTPSTADAAQQKIMMFMPVIMLVFFYSMPSGMILYWSVNQTMMIVQLYWQRYHAHCKTMGHEPPEVVKARAWCRRILGRRAAVEKPVVRSQDKNK